MADSIRRLSAFVAKPAPTLMCEKAGSTSSRKARARRAFACRHDAGRPAPARDLKRLARIAGPLARDFEAFYSKFAYLTLFRQEEPAQRPWKPAFVEFPAIEELAELRTQLREWLSAGEPEELDPVFAGAVPFARIPHSADLIFAATRGKAKGEIYQFSHDNLSAIPVADSLADFLAALADRTDEMIKVFASDLRCVDKSGEQWVPFAATAGAGAEQKAGKKIAVEKARLPRLTFRLHEDDRKKSLARTVEIRDWEADAEIRLPNGELLELDCELVPNEPSGSVTIITGSTVVFMLHFPASFEAWFLSRKGKSCFLGYEP